MATAKPKPKVWKAGPEKKSPGAATAAVRGKYRDVLNMRKEIANKKGGEAGKADLIAWKRASGYQSDWNAAKAKDAAKPSVETKTPEEAAADPDKRPDTLPTAERPDNGAEDRPMADKPKPEPTMAERVAAVKSAGNYNPPSKVKPKPNAAPVTKPKTKTKTGTGNGRGNSSANGNGSGRGNGGATQTATTKPKNPTPTPGPATPVRYRQPTSVGQGVASKAKPAAVVSKAPKSQPVSDRERRKTAPRTTSSRATPAVRRFQSAYGKG